MPDRHTGISCGVDHADGHKISEGHHCRGPPVGRQVQPNLSNAVGVLVVVLDADDPGWIHRQGRAGHGCLIAIQAILPGERGLWPSQTSDVLVVQFHQMVDCLLQAIGAVHIHPGEVPFEVGAAKGDEGEPLIQQVADATVVEVGVGEDKAVNPTASHHLAVDIHLVVRVGTGEGQDVIIVPGGGLGHAVDELLQDGVELIGRHRTPGVANHATFAGLQTFGNDTGPIAQLLHGLQYALPRIIAHGAAIVEHVRHRGDRDTSIFSNILNCRHPTSLKRLTDPAKKCGACYPAA